MRSKETITLMYITLTILTTLTPGYNNYYAIIDDEQLSALRNIMSYNQWSTMSKVDYLALTTTVNVDLDRLTTHAQSPPRSRLFPRNRPLF